MKLGVLFFASIMERTGAGKVVRSFIDGKHLFLQNGIQETKVYSLDFYKKTVPAGIQRKKTLKHRLYSLANKFLQKTDYGSYVLVNKLYFDKGRMVVDYYWEYIQKDDVLLFHELYTCNAYLERCSKESIAPKSYILVLHTNGELFKMTYIYYPKLKGSKYMKKLESWADKCLKNAGKLVFVAQMAADNFSTLYPQYRDKVSVVYNGIMDLPGEVYPNFDGKIKMVTVGTVNSRKNQILQIEAMQHLKKYCDVCLTIVGEGALEECRAKAVELGVADCVVFLGGRDDIPQILSQHNLFVMSSLDEGLPIAAIEAIRSKLPVILTDVGGDKELIKENGYLINPNLQELVDAVLSFAQSIEKQKKMSIASRLLFENSFSLEKMVEGYCNIVKDLSNGDK